MNCKIDSPYAARSLLLPISFRRGVYLFL